MSVIQLALHYIEHGRNVYLYICNDFSVIHLLFVQYVSDVEQFSPNCPPVLSFVRPILNT